MHVTIDQVMYRQDIVYMFLDKWRVGSKILFWYMICNLLWQLPEELLQKNYFTQAQWMLVDNPHAFISRIIQ